MTARDVGDLLSMVFVIAYWSYVLFFQDRLKEYFYTIFMPLSAMSVVPYLYAQDYVYAWIIGAFFAYLTYGYLASKRAAKKEKKAEENA